MTKNDNTNPITVVIFATIIALFIYVSGIVINIISVYELFDTTCGLNSWMNVGYQRFYYRTLQFIEKPFGSKVFDGFVEPPMPDNKLTDATLLGIDSNHDGIRDDVEIWINHSIEDKNLRLIFKQMARNEIFAMYMTARKDEAAMRSSFVYRDALLYCAADFSPMKKDNSTESFKKIEKLQGKLDKFIWDKVGALSFKTRCEHNIDKTHYNDQSFDTWKRCYSFIPGLEGKPYDKN